MMLSETIETMRPDGSEPSLVDRIVDLLSQDVTRKAFLTQLVPEFVRKLGGQGGGLVRQRSGQWFREVWAGSDASSSESLPERLIGDATDRGQLVISDGWIVSPLPREATESRDQRGPGADDRSLDAIPSSAIVIRVTPSRQDSLRQSSAERAGVTAATERMCGALRRIESQQRLSRRVDQLNAVLEAAAHWQRLDDDRELLHAIADTATKMLGCERASIFLWDRRRRKLVGRPALGIEGEALEVDDNEGVVGEVLRTSQPKIWNANTDDEKRVNRKVDQTLEFETRSLVAVPMGGQRGEIIGVFEAINHHAQDDDASGSDTGFDAFDAVMLADLAKHAAVAIESQRKRRTLTESRDRLVDDAASATKLIGNHPTMKSIQQSADRVAATELSVLVLGKNGTGKEVLARHIHYESSRRNGPFVAVNCAALVESLLESELFGHEKGAFTDANQTRSGKFELADGGTLFLDEVGDMSPGGQAKLLRVLEDKVVVRVGGSQTIPVDVRVIAATNQPLEQLIAEKRFREDLFFRLNVVSLTLPPLSQRGDDILLLAEHFLGIFCYQIGRQVPTLHPNARHALLSHPWRGNVRELRNTIERVCYLCNEDEIMDNDLMLNGATLAGITHHMPQNHSSETENRVDAGSLQSNFPVSLSDATREFQMAHIDRAIAECNGNMTDAAARLGLHRSNLYRKMRQLGMQTSGE
tara:strand:+ start:436358 stop:438457 length:2100 start_codon:yes stop_codon:yes gene_type:complete